MDGADPQIPAGTGEPCTGLCADRRPAWIEGRRSGRAEDAGQIGRELPGRADQIRSGEAGRAADADRRDNGGARQTSGRVSRGAGDILAQRRRHAGITCRHGAASGRARPMTRVHRILIVFAAIMGADGVILAAASAHQADATRLAAASSMLLFHATAVLASVALAERGLIHARIGLVAAFSFVIAASLFAGDLTLRRYAGHGLFPFAAPAGGTLLIASWLALAVAAAWPRGV